MRVVRRSRRLGYIVVGALLGLGVVSLLSGGGGGGGGVGAGGGGGVDGGVGDEGVVRSQRREQSDVLQLPQTTHPFGNVGIQVSDPLFCVAMDDSFDLEFTRV